MANLITVRLQRNEGQPWGFRLQGGKDFSSPLVLQRVNGGSVADQAGLMPGDALVKVNNTDVYNLRHKEAQDVIMAAGNSFELSISRGTAWRPSVTPTGSIPSPSPSLPGNITPVTKTSLAATPQPVQHIGSGHNQAAKPFPTQEQPQQQQQLQPEHANGGEGPIKSIVNKQYNTPVAMYSDETIAETLSSQAEVLAGGVLGVNFKKNERVYSPANSEVYKLLHEQGDDPEPVDGTFSNKSHYSIHKLESASSHFYATQSHAIGGYATAGRLPVGPLTKPRSPVPPQMLHPHPQPQTQPQHPLPKPPMMAPAPKPAQAPAPAPAPAPVQPAPQTAPRCGVPPRIHPDGQKSGVQAISAALNAHANLNGRSQSPYATNNQSNILPKPFGAPLPVSSHLSQVQPPSSFPPVTGSVPTPFAAACQAPSQAPAPAQVSAPQQPAVYPPMAAPAPAPVAAAPAAVPTQQGDEEEQDGDEEEEQVQKPAESPAPVFTWPPKRDEDEIVPLATPIYIPVPETQKVVVKPPERPREKSKSKSPPEIKQQQQQQQQQAEAKEEQQFVKSTQSKSAPELSRRQSGAQQQHQQQQDEESYETYTATTTSTSASSEEYQMYSTQTSEPIVTFYDTPVMEMDYPFSSGQRSAQASTGAMSDASYTHFVFRDVPPEVESVEPSVEPSIEPEREKSLEVVKPQKRVEFVDYRKELDRFLRAEQAASEAAERLKAEIEEVTEEFTIPHYELPVIKSPNPMPPKPIVPNPVPKQWQSKLVQALCTAPNDPIRLTAEQIEEANFMKSRNEAYVREQQETKLRQLEALKRQVDALERRLDKKKPEPEPEPKPYPPLDIPRKGSVMARVLASSTTKAERFPKYLPAAFVPLPDDTTPYFPPPHSMEPIRSEKISSIRASPFLEALTTAPYTPFQKFGTEIPSQMENMPVPSGRLSMTDALATAPERPYTPFTEVKLERSEMYQQLLKQQPSIQVDPEQNFSAFASVGGNRTPVPFKPIIPEIREPCEQPPEPEQPAPEPEPEPEPEPKVEEKKPEPENPKKKLPPYPRKDAGSDHYSLAPRRESNSPLHQPAEIPKYQRKWYNLATQNPPHTPEPEELRQNVPLAFVDTHSKAHLAKPIAQTVNTVNIRDQVALKKSQPFTTIQNRTIPVIQTTLEEDAELAQYNQYNNAHSRLQAKGVIDRGQLFTPSLILTKHPTTIPYYQHQLGFEEYFAESKEFDGRRTPQPVRKSPAFGPPPNPLKGYVPPSRDDIPNESGLYLSMGKLTGTPWYAHKAHVPADIQQKMVQQQHGMGGGYDASRHHKTVSYQQTPMTVQTQQHGDMTVQTRSQESAMREQASSERTINSASQEDEVPQKGFVAQQTRRFSGQDDALNIPPQLQQQESSAPQQPEIQPQQVMQSFPTQPSQPAPISFPTQPSQQAPSSFPTTQAPQPVTASSAFPSTALFPEPIVDRFPTKSARKASVLLPRLQARSPSPSSGFKAQFNQFMIGTGSMGTQQEEPENELTQSWPPQLPSFMSNTNPTANVRPPQRAAPAAPVAPPAVSNGRRPSNNSITGFSNNSNHSNIKSCQNNNIDRSGASAGSGLFNKGRAACQTTAPTRGRGVMNQAVAPGGRIPLCGCCNQQIRGPFITALGRIWCPDHFICHNANCKRPLADIGFVEEKGDLYCEYCFEEFLAPMCSKCNQRVKGDCLNAIGKQFHPECFKCAYCGKLFGNSPFFLEEGDPYCEADWNELFTTKCFACGFPVEAGDKWVEALNNNYHSQCFNCTSCKKNLEGQSFFAKGGRPFCKNHAR